MTTVWVDRSAVYTALGTVWLIVLLVDRPAHALAFHAVSRLAFLAVVLWRARGGRRPGGAASVAFWNEAVSLALLAWGMRGNLSGGAPLWTLLLLSAASLGALQWILVQGFRTRADGT